MPVEIERKFLVKDPSVVAALAGRPILQGYLNSTAVAVRAIVGESSTLLEIRGLTAALSDVVAHVAIPASEAAELLSLSDAHGRVAGLFSRVRIDAGRGVFTLKGDGAVRRREYEYPLPLSTAVRLLDPDSLSGSLAKIRYVLPAGAERKWEVDVFQGALKGLVTAEIELASEHEAVDIPDWVGAEVTHDARFNNASLALTQAIPAATPA